MTDRTIRHLFILSLSILAVYVIAQLVGPHIYSQGWSFTFLGVLPGWYSVLWIAAIPILFLLFSNLPKWEHQLKSRSVVTAGILLLLALLWFFRFDSFLYGGGNLRIAALSQVERIIPQWFEWGAMTVVSIIFSVIKLLEPRINWAAFYSWQMLSFVSTLAMFAASILVVRLLSSNSIKRLLLFFILFFGGQSVIYFGFVGIEPVIAAVTMWVFYFSIRLNERKQPADLIAMWALGMAGVVLHYSAVYLLPTIFYFTLAHLTRKNKKPYGALAASGILFIALLAIYYWHASSSFAFSRNALFFAGKQPFTNYGIFSYLHVIDLLQLLLLISPMIILAAVMLFNRKSEKKPSPIMSGWIVAAVSGLTFIFITDPENGMALDIPRFAAYLTPVACLFTILMNRFDYSHVNQRRLLAVAATAAVLVPAAYLPSLVRIHIADKFVTAFLTERDIYYRATCLSFRDVYWTLREMEHADRWEALLPVKSIDYMNVRGCSYLVANGDHAEAEKRLYQTIAKLPYWTEPRVIAAQLQIKLRRFDKARPQIDTCLMLEPNKKEHLVNLYSFYRDLPNNPEAIKTIDYMLTLFPTDPDIKTDQMIIMLRSGKPQAADSIAAFLLADDSTRAYPYIIKGMIAENRRDTASALKSYNMFLRYGALQPDTSFVRMRINALTQKTTAN